VRRRVCRGPGVRSEGADRDAVSFQPLARGLLRRRGSLLPGRHGGLGHIHDGRATEDAELNELRQVGAARAEGPDKGLGSVVPLMRCPHRATFAALSTRLTKVPDRSVSRAWFQQRLC
jgi:hypothetical protein